MNSNLQGLSQSTFLTRQGRGQGRSAGFQPVYPESFRGWSPISTRQSIAMTVAAGRPGRPQAGSAAIQQVGNLRYIGSRGLWQWPCLSPASGLAVEELIAISPGSPEEFPGCAIAPSPRPELAGRGGGRARNWLRLGAVAAALGASLALAQSAGLEKRNGASATLAEDQ